MSPVGVPVSRKKMNFRGQTNTQHIPTIMGALLTISESEAFNDIAFIALPRYLDPGHVQMCRGISRAFQANIEFDKKADIVSFALHECHSDDAFVYACEMAYWRRQTFLPIAHAALARHGRLEHMKALAAAGCNPGSLAVCAAAEVEAFEILEWLHQRRVPMRLPARIRSTYSQAVRDFLAKRGL